MVWFSSLLVSWELVSLVSSRLSSCKDRSRLSAPAFRAGKSSSSLCWHDSVTNIYTMREFLKCSPRTTLLLSLLSLPRYKLMPDYHIRGHLICVRLINQRHRSPGGEVPQTIQWSILLVLERIRIIIIWSKCKLHYISSRLSDWYSILIRILDTTHIDYNHLSDSSLRYG